MLQCLVGTEADAVGVLPGQQARPSGFGGEVPQRGDLDGGRRGGLGGGDGGGLRDPGDGVDESFEAHVPALGPRGHDHGDGDRRDARNASLRAEVRDATGELLDTAVGSFAIFPRR